MDEWRNEMKKVKSNKNWGNLEKSGENPRRMGQIINKKSQKRAKNEDKKRSDESKKKWKKILDKMAKNKGK